jgi:membrane protease YdiL (CAAX protease family)
MHNPTGVMNKSSMLWLFVVIVYGFSWLVWLPGILSSRMIIGAVTWAPLLAIGTCGPMLAAFYCLYRSEGWVGIRNWLRNGFTVRFARHWWIVILLVPFVIPALVLAAYDQLDGSLFPLSVFSYPQIVLPTILLMVTIGGGQEELGWRGYLLDRLQICYKPWQADLILTLIHSVWHLPLFSITMTMQSHYTFWLFLVFGLGFTLLINKIYRQTHAGFLSAIVFHGQVNAGLDTFPPIGPTMGEAV